MDGIVKLMRRGGWSGRGMIVDSRNGQVVETQIGPKAFGSKEAAIEWLRQVAAERAIEIGRIVLGTTR